MALANRSLERGLSLLDCFRPGVGVRAHRDLVEQTGLPKATVTRLVRTLCEAGYLVPDADRGGYRLGVPVLSLARALTLEHPLIERVSPVVDRLAGRIGAMVGFGTAQGSDIVYLDGVNRDASRPTRRIGPGLRVPIVGSSIGHAWLAGLPAAARAAEVARLRRTVPTWRGGSRAAIEAAVRDVRVSGHCSVLYNEGRHVATAMPAVGPGGIVYAFGIVCPVPQAWDGSAPPGVIEGLLELVACVESAATGLSPARSS